MFRGAGLCVVVDRVREVGLRGMNGKGHAKKNINTAGLPVQQSCHLAW